MEGASTERSLGALSRRVGLRRCRGDQRQTRRAQHRYAEHRGRPELEIERGIESPSVIGHEIVRFVAIWPQVKIAREIQ